MESSLVEGRQPTKQRCRRVGLRWVWLVGLSIVALLGAACGADGAEEAADNKSESTGTDDTTPTDPGDGTEMFGTLPSP